MIPVYQLPHVVQIAQSQHSEQVRLFNERNNVEQAFKNRSNGQMIYFAKILVSSISFQFQIPNSKFQIPILIYVCISTVRYINFLSKIRIYKFGTNKDRPW